MTETEHALRAALAAFVQVDDADRSGHALVHTQGQGMDGYTKLANYEACIPGARAALARAEGEPPEDAASRKTWLVDRRHSGPFEIGDVAPAPDARPEP